jgi:hypothetical protein
MKHYLIFEPSALDRVALKDSGYPWAALFFCPLWAFGKGLTLHGMVLAVLYVSCAALMGAATNGIVVGVAIALWLGVYTAHNATDWLTSLYEKRATSGSAASRQIPPGRACAPIETRSDPRYCSRASLPRN